MGLEILQPLPQPLTPTQLVTLRAALGAEEAGAVAAHAGLTLGTHGVPAAYTGVIPRLGMVFVKAGPPAVTDDSSKGIVAPAGWLNTTSSIFYVCLSAAVGAAVWIPWLVLGHGATQAIKGTHSHSGADGEGANLTQSVITNLVTNKGELALVQDSWRFDDAANETLRVEEYARYAKTLVSVAMKTSSGTCTAKFQIGGVDVTSLTALAVTNAWQVFTATAANAVAATGNVDLVLTAVTNMPKLYVVILYTKTLT